jgi:hypothetical protein
MNTNQPTDSVTRIPKWFWIVSILALLWNLAGLLAFAAGFMVPVDKMFPDPEMQRLVYETPLWYYIVFGTAVIAGTLGCICLLLRTKIALPVFIISLLGVIAQQSYMYFMSDTLNVMGGGAAVMPTVVLVGGIALIWFSKMATHKGWLR